MVRAAALQPPKWPRAKYLPDQEAVRVAVYSSALGRTLAMSVEHISFERSGYMRLASDPHKFDTDPPMRRVCLSAPASAKVVPAFVGHAKSEPALALAAMRLVTSLERILAHHDTFLAASSSL